MTVGDQTLREGAPGPDEDETMDQFSNFEVPENSSDDDDKSDSEGRIPRGRANPTRASTPPRREVVISAPQQGRRSRKHKRARPGPLQAKIEARKSTSPERQPSVGFYLDTVTRGTPPLDYHTQEPEMQPEWDGGHNFAS